jgi:hypothetical protein
VQGAYSILNAACCIQHLPKTHFANLGSISRVFLVKMNNEQTHAHEWQFKYKYDTQSTKHANEIDSTCQKLVLQIWAAFPVVLPCEHEQRALPCA